MSLTRSANFMLALVLSSLPAALAEEQASSCQLGSRSAGSAALLEVQAEEEQEDTLGLVQRTAVGTRLAYPHLAPWWCLEDHSEDLERPIKEVLAEHPGVDGYCYFWAAVPWFATAPWQHALRCYKHPRDVVTAPFGGYLGQGKGPLVTMHFDSAPASGLKFHLDSPDWAYDAGYCYALGFLKGQGLDGSMLDRYDDLRALGRRVCTKLQQEGNFRDDEMTMGSHIRMNAVIAKRSNCSAGLVAGGCRPVTDKDYKEHLYAKCVLGDIGGEISFCYQHGCLLPGNAIGHQKECD